MESTFISLTLIGVAFLGSTLAVTARASDDPGTKETPDRRFEKLLADAMKDPEKADWKPLREAFSRTSHYKPYSTEVTEKLQEIARSIGRGESKESEAALLKLLEQERFMRFDSVAMLTMLYEKTDRPEKAEKYKKLLHGILGVLNYPKAGTSFENPITVLFIQEEYLVATNMPVESQGLVINKTHRFDVLEIATKGDEPVKKIYFDIDLLRNAKSILDK